MSDMDKAKSKLFEEDLTLVIMKKSVVLFETRSHRISGFLGAIEQLGGKLEGATAADRVVGKAIAFLCVYAGISEVYAKVMSRKAKLIFEKNGISCEFEELVDNILDSNRNSVCPFEKVATNISNPQVAYTKFKMLLQSFKTCE